jgi:GGDEF domain-containing protein
LPLSISIGYALYPDHAENLDELVDKADSAMYSVKRGRTTTRN